MSSLPERRRGPFAVGAGVLAIVSVAVARLPESFVNRLERNGPFTFGQATWIFRLFLAAAVIQALYGGFVWFRTERIQVALARDEKSGRWPKDRVVAAIARNAVVAMLMPLVYGLVLVGLTGLRGSFWAFPLVSLAQGSWYYRLVGDVARWIGFQPEPPSREPPSVWQREPPDYCPPLARGLVKRH